MYCNLNVVSICTCKANSFHTISVTLIHQSTVAEHTIILCPPVSDCGGLYLYFKITLTSAMYQPNAHDIY